jgi:hypothetical protein
MSTILSFLGNLKLTLTQWALLCATTAIGVLVVALDLKGSQLHKTQVDLLHQQFGNSMQLQDAKVDAARAAFEDALHSYTEHSDV